MVSTFDTPRRGLSPALVVLATIGVLCCACSLLFAFGPTAKVATVREASESQQVPDEALAAGLEFVRQKLVDPDAQSNELEDPAILLDPDNLKWENKPKETTSEENAPSSKDGPGLDWSQGESFEEKRDDGEQDDQSKDAEQDQHSAGDVGEGTKVEIDGEDLNMNVAQRDGEGNSGVPLEGGPIDVEVNDDAPRARVPASTRRRARRASRFISDSAVDLTKPSQEEEQEQEQQQEQEQEQEGAQPYDDVQEDVLRNATLSKRDAESVRRFGKCALTQSLLDYTIERIRNAQLHLDPFPHLYLTKIFEPTFYQNCLLARLPPTQAYEQLPNNRDRNQIPLAGKFGHGPQSMDRVGRPKGSLDAKKAKLMDVRFWTEFARLFANKELGQTWLAKFYPTLQHRNIERRINTWGKSYWYTMSLGRDLKGYSIGPHTDTADKWVTTLYYLPKDDKHPDLGTAVVRSPTGKVARGNFRGKLNSEDFVIAKKAGFVRNAVMAFAACEKSWHAVQKVEGHIQRDTLQGFVSGQIAGGKKTCGSPGSRLQPPNGWSFK